MNIYWRVFQKKFSENREHKKEIKDGNMSHPLVIHFKEEHGGTERDIILRVLSIRMQ